MFVQVRLTTVRGQTITVIPRSAVYSVAGLTKVFTISGGRAKEHKVVPAGQRDGWVEIEAPEIRAGDSVATSNLAALSDQAEVRVEAERSGS
jgi:multidrug efflux pump subunit AcrA (membrane-fusion protein)